MMIISNKKAATPVSEETWDVLDYCNIMFTGTYDECEDFISENGYENEFYQEYYEEDE